ncbi:VOC family protein [Pandoraea apista]|uniref:VOC family protein n=1 Tax=Pandoraea apista TaxID=93218 RepID=UPI001CD7A39F|nr:VOC family protein [Pandoraea apista]
MPSTGGSCAIDSQFAYPFGGIAMIRYATLGTNNLENATVFYNRVLAPLDLHPTPFSNETFYGRKGAASEEVVLAVTLPFDGAPATHGNGTMIALHAASKQQVDAAYSAAMAQGGQCEGAPGPRPDYHPRMYVAYFRDLDGNKLAVVHFEPVRDKH